MGVPRKYKIIHLAENFYPIVISLNEIFSPSLEFIHSSSPSSQENIKLGGSSSSDVPHFIDVLLNNNQSLPENIKRTLKVIRFEKDSEVKYGFRCDSTSLNFGTPSTPPLSSFPPSPSSFPPPLFSPPPSLPFFSPSLPLSLLPLSLSLSLFLPFIFLSLALSLSPSLLNLLFLPSLFPPSFIFLFLPFPISFLTQSPFSSFPLSSSSFPPPFLPLSLLPYHPLLSLSLPLFPLSSIPPNFVTQSNIFLFLPTYLLLYFPDSFLSSPPLTTP